MRPSEAVKQSKTRKKRHKRERRILSFEETARVLRPHRRAIPVDHRDLHCDRRQDFRSSGVEVEARESRRTATIKIEQRVWHQEIGRPKSDDSRRVLGIGDLADRFSALVSGPGAMDEFVFQQKRAPGKPLWDSGVRDALHQAAEAEGCDFEGLGPHSFRRANITWRQQVGGSAIEASKIAGHSDLEMTGEYTFVTAERQNELTRRIQQKLSVAAKKPKLSAVVPSPATPTSPQAPATVATAVPSTILVQ